MEKIKPYYLQKLNIYEETGILPKTEENKEENVSYLNPQYIKYLGLSDSEREDIELIPEPFILDYISEENYSEAVYPKSYDIRNVSGKNFISPLKDQGSMGICWAFAAIENAETFLMKTQNKSYDSTIPTFSVRQLDYAASRTNIRNYANNLNSSRSIGGGGNFTTSSIIMANGLSLVDESVLPWNESIESKSPSLIFSYDNALYEVDSTIIMPTINSDTASQDKMESYVSDVKKYLLQYGGPFIGTYAPDSTCGFQNIDGKPVLKTDDCVSANTSKGHAMQIIGWDDDYEYSYCDNGTDHYSVENGTCRRGTFTQGKGAWLIRNSWGEDTDYPYFYLTYDSTRLSIGFITSMDEMSNRSWDNNYHLNPWIDNNVDKGTASVTDQTIELNTNNTNTEKIEKIKYLTSSKEGTYRVSVYTNTSSYENITTISTNEAGIYTIDLSGKGIYLDSSDFSVKIESTNDKTFVHNSISVFTSNVDETPHAISYSPKAYDKNKPLSDDNPLFVSGDNYWFVTVNSKFNYFYNN